MKNTILLVMLVLTLALGMMVVGCDDGSKKGKDDLPAASGANAVSGKTYFIYEERIVFSTTTEKAKNGTYTVGSVAYDEEKDGYILTNGKLTYVDRETGIYSWNEGAKTVTLQPERVAFYGMNGLGTPLDKKAFRSAAQAMIDATIAERGEADFNELLSEEGFSSIAAYLDYYVNETFANKTNGYSFSTDETALLLEKPLPTNKGSNELSGKTYSDTSDSYVFAASGNTYEAMYRMETGSYAYDSNRKRVWLRPSSINGKDRAAYYAAQTVESMDAQYYVNNDAYRAAKTNYAFDFWEQTYNSTDKTIGW